MMYGTVMLLVVDVQELIACQQSPRSNEKRARVKFG